jgi:hypothetical protein
VEDWCTKDCEVCVRQCLKHRAQRGIAHKVVRPRKVAVDNERLAVDKRRRVEARTELSPHIR